MGNGKMGNGKMRKMENGKMGNGKMEKWKNEKMVKMAKSKIFKKNLTNIGLPCLTNPENFVNLDIPSISYVISGVWRGSKKREGRSSGLSEKGNPFFRL